MGERGAPRDSRSSSASALVDALLAITLAPNCAACALPLVAPSNGPVCSECWSALRRLRPPCCPQCGDELLSWRAPEADRRCGPCRLTTSRIAVSRSAAVYEGPLRHVIHALKYQGRRRLTGPLAALLAQAGSDVVEGASCVVPVPLHPLRRLSRGFNQAADLASRLPLPLVHALVRRRATAPQEGLTASERRHNVRGAFAVSPLLRPSARRRLLEGQIVVVIDDVRTTGATLEQCAGTLLDAGVVEVRALTVALARAHAHEARAA